ncbi:patatin-like protein 2 [Quercus suber]|uniref:Patatin-like protein 2 n=1 Tax=Quercus suber TaxID=58331 RepID=A0AAW0MJ68_QUESU
MAITQIRKEISFELPDIKPTDYRERMLVLSLGTGGAKHEEKYTAARASKWRLFSWVYDNGATPLLDVFTDASSDIVDIHVSTLFQAIDCKKNYLPIQDDTLTGDASSVDIATTENLQSLWRLERRY